MLLMGKLTISMAIFNSYVKLPEGKTSIMLVYNYRLFIPNQTKIPYNRP